MEGGERFGRYSIIGLPAKRVVTFRGLHMEIRDHGALVESRDVTDPFAEVEALRAAHSVPKLEGLPGFTGGLVGWFGFECIGYIEPRLAGGDTDVYKRQESVRGHHQQVVACGRTGRQMFAGQVEDIADLAAVAQRQSCLLYTSSCV